MTNTIEKAMTSLSRSPSRKLPPYLLAVFIMFLGFSVVSAGVVTVVGNRIPPSNPFASYVDVFPGQLRSAVEARGFLCYKETYEYRPNEHCSINQPIGAFSQVGVVVSEDVIGQISFRIRANTLRVGDLMILWGMPEVQEHSRSVYLYWRSNSIFAIASHDTGRFSLFLPVRRVYFAATASSF